VCAAALSPAAAFAQRAPAVSSLGRGTIVQFEQVRDAHVVYLEESGGMKERAAPDKTAAREEASTKATRAASAPNPVAADAPARRTSPRRVAAPGDPRGERP
jgi:hypothetical protein